MAYMSGSMSGSFASADRYREAARREELEKARTDLRDRRISKAICAFLLALLIFPCICMFMYDLDNFYTKVCVTSIGISLMAMFTAGMIAMFEHA